MRGCLPAPNPSVCSPNYPLKLSIMIILLEEEEEEEDNEEDDYDDPDCDCDDKKSDDRLRKRGAQLSLGQLSLINRNLVSAK